MMRGMNTLPIGATLCSSDDPSQAGHVYVLVDSRSPDTVRYVGSAGNAAIRFDRHIRHTAPALSAWVSEVIEGGGQVLMRSLIREADRMLLYAMEGRQIRAYQAIGMADLNGRNVTTGYRAMASESGD